MQLYNDLHAWPAPRDPVVEASVDLVKLTARLVMALWRGARALWRALDRGIALDASR